MSFLSMVNKFLRFFKVLSFSSRTPPNENSTVALSSASSVAVADNADLLRQILVSLPVKSLLKFKSVSKEWLSLISHSQFVLEHYLLQKSISPLVSRVFILQATIILQPKPLYLFDVLGRRDVGQVPYKTFIYFLNGRQPTDQSIAPVETLAAFKNDPSDIKILHSCNGLFICSTYNTYYRNQNFYIYNPSTKWFKILHPSPFRRTSSFQNFCSVNLVFDPLKSTDYEVVYVWSHKYADSHQIEIYSSRTDSWRLCGDVFSASVYIFRIPGVFWNGSLHWTNACCSIYLDIDQEMIKPMPSSPMRVDKWDIDKVKSEYFGECNGHLYYIQVRNFSPTQFEVFEMDIGYTGWYAKYYVDIQELTVAYPEMVRQNAPVGNELLTNLYDFSILAVDEDEESPKLLIEIPDKIISYDLKEMSFKRIHDLERVVVEGVHVAGPGLGYDTFRYIESLAHV